MLINKKKYFALAAISAAMMQISNVTYAAEEIMVDEKDKDEIEVITVTSSRRIQAIQDVPASVVAIDPAVTLGSGLNNTAEMTDYVPGFHIMKTGVRGSGSITARGVGQLGATTVTAVYIDDIPMTSNSGFAGGGNVFFDGLLGDVERIELIKGPQGTLFGATAIAGAVRYISREPALDESRGSITADFSSTKNGGVSKQYRGFVSVPLIEETLGLTLSGFSADDAGFVDQVDTETGNILIKDANDSENKGYSADLYYQTTDDLSFRIKWIEQDTVNGFGSNVRLASLEKKPMYGELKHDTTYADSEIENKVFSASMAYELSFASLDLTTSKIEYNYSEKSDDTASFAPYVDILTGQAMGTTTRVDGLTYVDSKKEATELRLTSKNNDKFEWIVGLYSADESTNNIQSSIAIPGDINVLNFSLPSEYQEVAAFGSLTYYLTSSFDLTAGMRYADTETGLNLNQSGLLLNESKEKLKTAKDKVQTYSFSARYRPSDDTSLYGSISSGYRPASSSFELIDPSTGELLSPGLVEQDTLWSYEVGAKGVLADNTISYDTALWYIDWKDFQSLVNANGLSSLGNAQGGVTAYGFEGSMSLNLDSGFSLTSSVAYASSTLDDDEPLFFGVKGAHMPRVPEWTFSTIARYDFELSNDMLAWLGAGIRYTQGSDSAFVNDSPYNESINLKGDDVLLVDLNAGIEWAENVIVNIYVKNLLNNDSYFEYGAIRLPGTAEEFVEGAPVTPRVIGASVSYIF